MSEAFNAGSNMQGGVPVSGGGTTTAPGGSASVDSATRETARGIVTEMLDVYGLVFDEAMVNRWVGLFADDPANMPLIEQEMKQTTEYRQRFPGMQARIDNGYDPISPAEYVDLESQYRMIIRNSGLPEQFYDTPQELSELIVNNVAPAEFEQRVVRGFIAARDAPDEVRDALESFYGIGDSQGALAAYFLDPDKALPAIVRQFETAQIAGRAEQTGYRGLTMEQAERLQSIGVDANRAQAGFADLGADAELFQSNLGQDDIISTQQQLAAEFEDNAEAQAAIRRRREQRIGAFRGTAGGGVTQFGVAGLGDND